MPGVRTLFGTDRLDIWLPSLPDATTATISMSNSFSKVERMVALPASLIAVEVYMKPNEMLKISAPLSAAHSIPVMSWLRLRPEASCVLIHITCASGAMPVIVPEVPSPAMIPAQCVP